jgi:hypothetical protein
VDNHTDEIEVVVDPGDGLDDDDDDFATTEQVLVDSEENTQEDDGQIAHDDAVVKSLRDIAIRDMEAEGVVMSDEERQMALKLFPAV